MYFDLVRNIAQQPNPKVIWLSGDQRIELSGVTLANGISKAANFLLDSWQLTPGKPIRFALAKHWQSTIWLNAALVVGARIQLTGDAEFAIATPQRLNEISGADEIGQLSVHPFGLGVANDDPFITDLATEVRAHGDLFSRPIVASGVAIEDAHDAVDFEQLVEQANQISQNISSPNTAIGQAPDSVFTAVVYATLPLAVDKALVIIDGVATDELLAREYAQLVKE
jgi:uncharacterized protein (TIGR03089 family)